MLNTRYVQVETVIEDINRDNPFPFDLDPNDATEWIGKALELIDVPVQNIRRMTDDSDHPKIVIANGRGELPCDLIHITQVKECKTNRPLRYSTDAFHVEKGCIDLTCVEDLQYTINDSYIFVNFDAGHLIMSYTAYPTDVDGRPLIPDNAAYKEAMKAFVMERMGYKLYLQSKIDRHRYELLQQERAFYMASARTMALTPNRDQMESIKNLWVRLLPNNTAHSTGMSNTGQMERFKNHTGRRRWS